MKHSKQLFTHYMTIWARLLQQAAGTSDPATYLLSHDARTPLFYLEGMTRVLMHENNPKKMRRLNEWFKKIEDALGTMDYYTGMIQDFNSNRKIPVSLKRELVESLKSAAANLNTLLIELGWLGEKANRLQKIHQYNQDMDWLTQKNLHLALKKRYQSDVRSIVRAMKRPFEEIERDVHELRRDVRWLSIYPQAFKGFVNLQTVDPIPESLLKYATPETVQSPFNQLAKVAGVNKVLNLNTHAYYAMSWLISQLGVLKDSGLRLLALAELLKTHNNLSEAEALKSAQTMLGAAQPSVDDLLNTARGLILQLQNDKTFTQLLIAKDTPVVKVQPAVKSAVKAKAKATTKPAVKAPNKAAPKIRATSAVKTTASKTTASKATATKTTASKTPAVRTTRVMGAVGATRATPATKARAATRTTTRTKPATKPSTTAATKTPVSKTRTTTTRTTPAIKAPTKAPTKAAAATSRTTTRATTSTPRARKPTKP